MASEASATAGKSALVRAGNFWFHWRNTLFPFAFLLVFVPGPPLFRTPFAAALAGFAVAGLGQFVRAFTIGFRYVIRGGRNRRVYAEDLVTDGLYHHVRNPMYVGNLLIMCGVALASNSWGCLLVAVPLFLGIYAAIVAAEEDFLRSRFGAAFDAYCRDVPRWIPRFAGLGETLRGMKFHWRRVIVKEYGTPLGWVCGVCLLALWNEWYPDRSFAGEHAIVRDLLLVMGVMIVAWALAWYLKKSRTLVAD
jgi:protein-S-isoprenylcysteine O-methyltransferase Ste14